MKLKLEEIKTELIQYLNWLSKIKSMGVKHER